MLRTNENGSTQREMDAVQRYGAKYVSLARECYAEKNDLIRWAEQWGMYQQERSR